MGLSSTNSLDGQSSRYAPSNTFQSSRKSSTCTLSVPRSAHRKGHYSNLLRHIHCTTLRQPRFLFIKPKKFSISFPEIQDASISIWRLFLALLCPISIVFLSWHLNLDISRKIVISVLRTIVQLLLAGYVLLSFIFSMNSPVYVLLYLLLMMLIAAVEATSRQIRTYQGHFLDSLIAVFLGGGVIGAFGAIVVFSPDPWWQPNVMVRESR